MKQANFVVFFFLAAAFLAVLTGCPVTPSDHDQGINPMGDAGPDSDGNVDVPDAGPDSEVLPDGGTDDLGQDGGTVDPCADPEYVGKICNLPAGVAYSRDAFLCAGAIDHDLWISDAVGATPRGEDSYIEGDVLYVFLRFLAGYTAPVGVTRPDLTCGPEGACWLNWKNPASAYAHCKVSFATDCSTATTECWPPGVSTPTVTHAAYVGPQ